MRGDDTTRGSMKSWSILLIFSIAAGMRAWAQEQPPAGQAGPPEIPAAPVALLNTGKPIVLPFQCTAEDTGSAGFSCSEEAPCPVYLELSAAAAVGNKYYVAGNIHSDAVTLYSVLLGSPDAGRTWREIHQRIRLAGLDHLQFLDAETGWAGGQQLFPLPQDPFVLLTTDGGTTWRQEPIFGENADYHFGSIQEMHFTSKTVGSLVVDRSSGGEPGPFALYESADGGESWTVREQNGKPLHVKGALPADADWRVRVDAVTKAFQLEHRQGERWTQQASFAVNIGFCKLAAQ